MTEPKDPTPEEQLAARIWERYKTDKRYPYVKLGMKLWKDGCRNMGQIMDALAYLHSQTVVRSPWAVVTSSPVMRQALASDQAARAVEASRMDGRPQLVGEILSGALRKVHESATDNASRNPQDPATKTNSL